MLVGVTGDATYANYAEAKLALWTDTILPLMQSVLASLNKWLEQMYGEEIILWYDEDMIAALEPLRRQKAERIELSTTMSINEKRRAMGYDDVDGGDVILVESSKVPLDIASGIALPEQNDDQSN